MGCTISKPTGLSDGRVSKLTARIKECIKKKKEEESKNPHPITLEKIVLKMEKCKMVLGTIKKVFTAYSTDGGKTITKEGLQKCMMRLHSNLADSDLQDLFSFIDLDHSKTIDLKEFVVSLTVCMLLGKLTVAGLEETDDNATTTTTTTTSTSTSPSAASASPSAAASPGKPPALAEKGGKSIVTYRKECIEMLNLILVAYLTFDPEGSGSIKKHMVEKILEEHTSRSVRRSGRDGPAGGHFFVSAATWERMDWNHDGEIDLAEFIYSFTQWIDVEEMLDEDY
jgi:hypothetical protein